MSWDRARINHFVARAIRHPDDDIHNEYSFHRDTYYRFFVTMEDAINSDALGLWAERLVAGNGGMVPRA